MAIVKAQTISFLYEHFILDNWKKMEVKISFDTEKDTVEDLKKLVAGLQDLIAQREGSPQPVQQQSQPKPQSYEPPKPQAAQQMVDKRTSGGGRVIPYQDMSGEMAKIFSGKNRYDY